MLSCVRSTGDDRDMGAAAGKEAFRSAVLDLVNNQQVRERHKYSCKLSLFAVKALSRHDLSVYGPR